MLVHQLNVIILAFLQRHSAHHKLHFHDTLHSKKGGKTLWKLEGSGKMAGKSVAIPHQFAAHHPHVFGGQLIEQFIQSANSIKYN